MNVFSKLKVYGEGWKLTNSRKLEENEIAEVERAEVVPSDYGASVCFFMKDKRNGRTYLPLSRDSSLEVGEEVDLKKIELLELERDGQTILRVK